MIEITGKYTSAKIFNDYVEQEAIAQIYDCVNSKAFDGQTIRIMPDCHAGKGSTIGFVSTFGNYVNPNMVGVDIGCMIDTMLYDKPVPKDKYAELNHKILKSIGFGFNMSPKKAYDEKELYRFLTHEFNVAKSKHFAMFGNLPDNVTEKWVSEQLKRIGEEEAVFYNSINSVGGGNHFIEYGESDDGLHFGVTVHCGSRNFGVKVCNYWANRAKGNKISKSEMKTLVEEYKSTYLDTHKDMSKFDKDLNLYIESKKSGHIEGFLTGDNLHGYLCDMLFAQAYAKFNHKTIHNTIQGILLKYNIKPVHYVSSVHNYIDFDTNEPLIRKGAIRAYSGEEMVVPFNMRDGLAICEGLSNSDWLCSCAHGAGRKMSRSKAKQSISLDDFKDTMRGIYSTTVCEGTIDESPFAYKDTIEIRELISSTCKIKYMLIPKINIKATDS